MKLDQKFIAVEDDQVQEVNQLISEGWMVTQMSACICGSTGNMSPTCFVLLEKFREEEE